MSVLGSLVAFSAVLDRRLAGWPRMFGRERKQNSLARGRRV